MADPKHPEHKAMMTWHGRLFDANDIDAERINRRLAVIARRRNHRRTPGRALPDITKEQSRTGSRNSRVCLTCLPRHG